MVYTFNDIHDLFFKLRFQGNQTSKFEGFHLYRFVVVTGRHIHKTCVLGGSSFPTHAFGHGTRLWRSLSQHSLDGVRAS